MAVSRAKLAESLELIKFKPEFKENVLSPIENFLQQSFNKDIGSSCIFIRPNDDCSTHLVDHISLQYLKKKSFRKYMFIGLDCALHRNQSTIIREIARFVYRDNEYTKFKNKLYNEQLMSLSDYFKTVVKKVILVLLNMDRLMHEANQTLIYTLFDATRYNSNFIFIGDTTRLNIIEMMEKRVKSRFSHQIYTLNCSISVRHFVNYLKEIITNTLSNQFNDAVEQLSDNILLQDTSYRQLNHLSILAHVSSVDSQQNNPTESLKKFNLNCIQSNDIKILEGLSNFELVIVLLATKIAIQKSSSCAFTQLQLFSDFKEFIERTNYRVIDADLFIFNITMSDLCCYGIIIKSIDKYQRYQLSVDPYEIVEYVKKTVQLPQDIKSIVYNR